MGEALAAGAQVYITGDISHHEGIERLHRAWRSLTPDIMELNTFYRIYGEYLMRKLGDAVKVVREKPAFPIQIV